MYQHLHVLDNEIEYGRTPDSNTTAQYPLCCDVLFMIR